MDKLEKIKELIKQNNNFGAFLIVQELEKNDQNKTLFQLDTGELIALSSQTDDSTTLSDEIIGSIVLVKLAQGNISDEDANSFLKQAKISQNLTSLFYLCFNL